MNRKVKVIVIVIGLYLVWISAKGLWDLKKVGKRVEESRERLRLIKQENQALERRLKEVSSVEFLEKEAREKLNLQKPGEVVVVLPDDQIVDGGSGMVDEETETPNWQKWWRLFFN